MACWEFTDTSSDQRRSLLPLGHPNQSAGIPDVRHRTAATGILGGGPQPGMMLRESPTLASLGITRIEPQADGMFAISSFFDVFTELSLNHGITWLPATNGSIPLILVGGMPLNEFPADSCRRSPAGTSARPTGPNSIRKTSSLRASPSRALPRLSRPGSGREREDHC